MLVAFSVYYALMSDMKQGGERMPSLIQSVEIKSKDHNMLSVLELAMNIRLEDGAATSPHVGDAEISRIETPFTSPGTISESAGLRYIEFTVLLPRSPSVKLT